VEKNLKRLGVGSENDELTDTTVEGLGSCERDDHVRTKKME